MAPEVATAQVAVPGAGYKPRSLHAAADLARRFPARPDRGDWAMTRRSGGQVLALLSAPPFARESPHAQAFQYHGARAVLAWLNEFPGDTWQDRFLASTAEGAGNSDWKHAAAGWWSTACSSPVSARRSASLVATGLIVLICAEVIRPGQAWLLDPRTPKNLSIHLARTRDHQAWARLRSCGDADPAGSATKANAIARIAVLQASKGGHLGDITVGDCLQLLQLVHRMDGKTTSGYFYQLLHMIGVFDVAAPSTVRAFATIGQRSAEQLIDRYQISCRPVRDLLVCYLRERQTTVDYATLQRLAGTLGNLFWADLERHHPGIDSLRLSPEAAASWKQRVLARQSGLNTLAMVRAFYLDIAQWAMEDPAQWGPWALPCPIRSQEMSRRKAHQQRKSRMDQRTRERLPALPTLVAAVNKQRRVAAEQLTTARAAAPGQEFTTAGQTLVRARLADPAAAAKTWADDPATGQRRDLTFAEHQAFWAWAVVEVLRHTGLRIEELCELSHHSFVQYTLPDSGELIPLLHVAPSKTDSERLLVIGPELADVLSAIVCRIRAEGAVPLVAAHDYHEKVWNAPMPLLFQRRYGGEDRPIIPQAIRRLLDAALAQTGLTDNTGRPLKFVPHDFRRIFITDAIMNGMPPHIAQLIVGHGNINTTMGYKAVYPEEAINGHRAFIARRRKLRPGEEYRTPTDAEWDEFLGHFERRKVALGTCGRAYSTPCIHEHSCLRCPLLRPDPEQHHRMVEVRDNLIARISEAQHNGWLGEVEGLEISLAATSQKLTQLHELATRTATVHLGMPHVSELVSRTIEQPAQ